MPCTLIASVNPARPAARPARLLPVRRAVSRAEDQIVGLTDGHTSLAVCCTGDVGRLIDRMLIVNARLLFLLIGVTEDYPIWRCWSFTVYGRCSSVFYIDAGRRADSDAGRSVHRQIHAVRLQSIMTIMRVNATPADYPLYM